MKQRHSYFRITLSLVLLILWAIFIFGMSGESGEESAGLSGKIAKEIYKIAIAKKVIKFDTLHFLIRKCAHFTEYGILELLLLNVVYQMGIFSFCVGAACIGDDRDAKDAGKDSDSGNRLQLRRNLWLTFATTIIICFIYAALDEFHQTFVAGRDGNIRDVFIDTSGSFCFGLLGFYGIIRILKNKMTDSH